MEQRLSERVRNIKPSATMSVDAKTKSLVASGQPVINMSVGEPDFDTPTAAAFAGIRAITNGNTRYTPAAGTVALRQAIARKLMTENGLTYAAEQIIVSNGAKHTLYNVFVAICDEGDEVILPAPYWVSYPEQIELAGAKPVIVGCDESTQFKMTPAQLEAAITPNTKAVLLNTPSNPTGAVYHEEELQALAKVLRNHDVYVVLDEIYERLVYDVKQTSLAAIAPELQDRVIVVNGFSKAFAMTGWRLGYAAAPADVAKAMASFQSHSTGSPSSMSQAAGLTALSHFDPAVVETFQHRRDVLVEGLNALAGVSCLPPEGAFYAFPDISGVIGKRYEGTPIESATDYCQLLLEKALVASVPGDAFGSPNHVRFSYAVADDDIAEAVQRMRQFHQKLS
ncbi:pyridoxal phosphate-dependent aminotransferase [Alicyclobacillus fastidiosus]|uniref:Aminotransferase n=1 Tax=Alicyclobacillus fastidiosus TaxID=392011 RepID=A0ABY6ZG38_9BACL|nr:pyridoxal phosphate-dependent aminotransferase [Alicyclobacillus fastidiosus]WAH41880.1 pyridoxal phosphate-dependent aminotransferase [Alicyclobacillus fastidiosus]GMA63590.1 aminotransferase [Alicyclobacillus fastidiosus]